MSDGLWYNQKMLGSVHYFVYKEGHLQGHNEEIYLRLNHSNSLETLLRLSPKDKLKIGEKTMSYETFERDVLAKVRDIHFDYTSVNKPAPGVLEVAEK